MQVADVIRVCKARLASHYGVRFAGLILYGSEARHQADAESDIDLLVLLREPFDYYLELQQVVEVLYPIQLECERLIAAIPVLLSDYERGTLSIYRNAMREGDVV